jgi:hypothetical protein
MGRQFEDRSAAYRLFEEERFDRKKLFGSAIASVPANTDEGDSLYAMTDDTIVRKRGRKVAGAAWKRDPLGPAFHTDFVWGQRYLQISATLQDFGGSGRARGIPIDFIHAPSAVKPRKNSPPEAWDEYRRRQKPHKLTSVGASGPAELREQVPGRRIVCAVDGGYTNQELFSQIPDNTVLIGRIRKYVRRNRSGVRPLSVWRVTLTCCRLHGQSTRNQHVFPHRFGIPGRQPEDARRRICFRCFVQKAGTLTWNRIKVGSCHRHVMQEPTFILFVPVIQPFAMPRNS